MKVKFYADIWPGMDTSGINVFNISFKQEKPSFAIRFFFEVDFPTEAITIPEPSVATVAKEDIIKISKPPWREES